ncbi:hypothetical protein SM11_pC0077 (plasmid) [Sinorhizobium meliloti SM11]|uniref:Uncharacterized protein n=1 Tax=Sinorhizobium meliloti (strain SM11) TaxID=707241 RepID=F7XAW6_SINMM|nr:hypothetical protein SM11_pC0077 [Sinorhizobium meliloti SM11]ARS67274.1 hypothetical protein SMRU11_08845 [Sinorhizobium meliloti RU11/001]RVG58874.1 hypothetical protein CN222_29390 [Sinorhizobium meliloti]RVH72312.1 hypothetical protein CN203_28060 [Sinorhizobium meliloti]RVI22447.1 hypothetical protein CN207_28360 [Sinorhizobium meliloti]
MTSISGAESALDAGARLLLVLLALVFFRPIDPVHSLIILITLFLELSDNGSRAKAMPAGRATAQRHPL